MDREREFACIKYSSVNVMYRERVGVRQVQFCERDRQRESECMREVQLGERDGQIERLHASSTAL